jgi:hypothetical protein
MNAKFHFVRLLAVFLFFNGAIAARAGTIIKLDLGGTGPDVGMSSAGGVMSTVSDGDATTTGDQDTAVTYTGFLSFLPNITNPTASFTLSGLTAAGPAQQFGSLVIQNYAGGQLSLFDPSNNLLLTANLTGSALSGSIGPPGTAALFTTNVSSSASGPLAQYFASGSISMSISMINVNAGAGLALSDGVLQPFQADASVLIAADPVAPEPCTMALLAIGSIGLLIKRRFVLSLSLLE